MGDKRNYNLDILRIFALLCVVSVHFFIRTGYYNEILKGSTLFFSTTIRSFFMICVPLFIILSGYLMNKKTPTKKYFLNIKKILIDYLLCSVVCYIAFAIYYKEFNILDLIFGTLSYSHAKYAWYVEMYIGLYLLMPYLNTIYNNLKSQNDKKTLIAILIFLTSIPTITNFLNLSGGNIIRDVGIHQKILPEWWYNIYPLTYYFIGCYLSEYKLKINKWLSILSILAVTIIQGIISFYMGYNQPFSWDPVQSYNSLIVLINSTLVFNLISNLNIKFDKKGKTKKVLKLCSDSVFCAFLVSCIFDKLFYEKIFFKNITNFSDKILYMPLVVLSVFIASMLFSIILKQIEQKILRFIRND